MIASYANLPPNTTVGREFIFTAADFRKICTLIFERAGISLSTHQVDMVYSRLSRRLRYLGLASFAEYLELLSRGDQEEWSAFISALTTHMTSFFREQHHFPILAGHLAERRANGPLRLWSCAASTGEEPYSMAITAAEAFDSLAPPVAILATDVDGRVLAEAEEGIYHADRVSHLPSRVLKRYFEWGSGKNQGCVRIRPELRRLVTFQKLNLIDPVWPIAEPFDAIFCRNVMIYFDRPTQRQVLSRSRRHLKPDGLYFAGHSENLSYADELFSPLGQTVYRRQADLAPERDAVERGLRQHIPPSSPPPL
jgi:chemotaxis protein methyltransferase CheR